MASASGPPRGEGRRRGEEAEAGSQGREEAPLASPGVSGAHVARLREDATGPGVGILQEGGGVPFEIQGVLPPERDRFLRLNADDVVAEGAQADCLGDRPPSWLGEVCPASRDLREGALDRFVDEVRSEEHTSELQSHVNLVCRLLLEKKKKKNKN